MKGVSENVLYLLGFERFSLVFNPINDFISLDQTLPLIHQRSQTVNLERILFAIVYGEDIHKLRKGLKIDKGTVRPLTGTKVLLV